MTIGADILHIIALMVGEIYHFNGITLIPLGRDILQIIVVVSL